MNNEMTTATITPAIAVITTVFGITVKYIPSLTDWALTAEIERFFNSKRAAYA